MAKRFASIVIALLVLGGATGLSAAHASCTEGGQGCLERSWDERDRCLATCRRGHTDGQGRTGTDRCSRDCVRRRREWTACCDQGDDCGANCKF